MIGNISAGGTVAKYRRLDGDETGWDDAGIYSSGVVLQYVRVIAEFLRRFREFMEFAFSCDAWTGAVWFPVPTFAQICS